MLTENNFQFSEHFRQTKLLYKMLCHSPIQFLDQNLCHGSITLETLFMNSTLKEQEQIWL